jgi:TonB family protein
MFRKYRKPILIALILSLLIHFGFFVRLFEWTNRPLDITKGPVEVRYVTPEELEQEKALEKVKKAPGVKVHDQVVEQKDRINDELDEKTRFLSAHNQKVIKQTRAERTGKFNNTAEGGRPDEGVITGDKKSNLMDVKAHKAREKGELPSLQDLAPKFSLTPGPRAPEREKNGDPSQSDDYLKDVNKGMQTLLSTREFVYYSYYSRIKDAIRQHWEPNVREKVKIIYRQGRTIASSKDRVTQVLVTLNSQGELLNVEVLSQSGVDQLDAAALEAFRAASPFPNPPKGMVESDGTIKIRWDFVLEA